MVEFKKLSAVEAVNTVSDTASVLIEEDGVITPKIKVSEAAIKVTKPSFKKVYRFYDKETGYALGDVIALAEENIPLDQYTLVDPIDNWKQTTISNYEVKELQVPIFQNGELVYENPSVEERQKYCHEQFKTLYPEIQRIAKPHGYYVDLTIELLKLKKELIESHVEEVKAKELVKK